MLHLSLSSAISAMSKIDHADGFLAISDSLKFLAGALHSPVAAIWRYNTREGFCSCYSRYGYTPRPGVKTENVHEFSTSLISDIYSKLSGGTDNVLLDLADPSIYRKHWAQDAINLHHLRYLLAIPFSNLASSPSATQLPSGVILFYFTETPDYNSSLPAFITFAYSRVYTNYILKHRDDTTGRIIDYFSKKISGPPSDVITGLCEDVIKPTFNVEACSLYEWNAHQNAFKLVSTTGLVNQSLDGNHYDRPGNGLVSEIAAIKRTISILDILNTDDVQRLLRRRIDPSSINKFIEKTDSPPKSVLLVPVFNPVQAGHSSVSAVLKLVNKNLRHCGEVDYFSANDINLAEEVATMIALYEEQSRSLKQQVAFGLQFGHEAQAPAVGIRGTADRILLKADRKEFEQIPSMAQDIYDFSEILIAFAESLSFGFGDKSIPKAQRYSFRQFNIRKSVDAAKKIVIPICRSDGLQFDDISILGSFPLIFSDQRAFMQIFYNLLTNAIKYRSRNGDDIFKVIISCRSLDERAVLDGDDNTLRLLYQRFRRAKLFNKAMHIIDFCDFGVGISTDEAQKVFLQGFRSPSIGSNDIRGSGIGLSIVRNILIDFDSVIWVAKLKNPTTFRIAIPDALESSSYVRRGTFRRNDNA